MDRRSFLAAAALGALTGSRSPADDDTKKPKLKKALKYDMIGVSAITGGRRPRSAAATRSIWPMDKVLGLK